MTAASARPIRAGFESIEPRTHTRTVLIAGSEETDGRGWVLEMHCPEGAAGSRVAGVSGGVGAVLGVTRRMVRHPAP